MAKKADANIKKQVNENISKKKTTDKKPNYNEKIVVDASFQDLTKALVIPKPIISLVNFNK